MKRPFLQTYWLLIGAILGFALVYIASPKSALAAPHAAAPAKKAPSHAAPAKKTKKKSADDKHGAAKSKPSHAKEDTKSAHGKESGAVDHASMPASPTTFRIALVLDSSRSMTYTDPKNLRNQAARLFVRFLQPGDEIAILSFDSTVQTVMPFTSVTQETIPKIDAAIEGIQADGNFTDLEQPLEASLKLFKDTRPGNAVPNVVLLSDGKMDPRPSRGSAEELTRKVFEEDLPQFNWQSIRLFTLALGDQADAELLRQMAEATGGTGWSARDVDTVHAKFSELFLSIKKPQLAPIEKGGFVLDESVAEVTFYLSRKGDGAQAELVDPLGKKISLLDLPPNVRWYKGELFDVITIAHPQAGRWKLIGGENPEGFATLLSNLKLKVEWPENLSHVDQKFKLEAQLIDGEKNVNASGIKEITSFTYRIAEDSKGATIASGELRDDGHAGDHKADDGIYTASLSVSQAGKFALIVGASSPTFSRFQQIPISLGHEPISLSVETVEEGHLKAEKFVVRLSQEMAQLRDRTVKIVAQGKESGEEFSLIPETNEHDEALLELSTAQLITDEYEVYASVSGEDPHGKKVSERSEALHYSATNSANAQSAETLAKSRTLQHMIGFAFFLLSLLTGAFLWRRFVSAAGDVDALPQPLPPFSHDPTLLEQISVIRTRSSEQKRAPDADERELFALVKDVLPIVTEPQSTAENAGSAAPASSAAVDAPTDQPSSTATHAGEAQVTETPATEAASTASTDTPHQQEG